MLAKKNRLTKNDNIKYILSRGDKKSNDFFIFKYLKNKLAYFKFCVIVSSKFKLEAWERNKLRRQIYEAVRLNYRLLADEPKNIAIIVKHPALEAKYQILEKNIINLMQKISP